MRNFDYLKDLELTDLHRFCSAAEENQVCNPLQKPNSCSTHECNTTSGKRLIVFKDSKDLKDPNDLNDLKDFKDYKDKAIE